LVAGKVISRHNSNNSIAFDCLLQHNARLPATMPPQDNPSDLSTRRIPGDDTTKHILRRELAVSSQILAGVFAASPVGIVIQDESFRMLEANPAIASLLGYDIEEMLALGDPRCLIHADDLALLDGRRATLREWQDTRSDQAREVRYLHKSGRAIWCRLNSSLLAGPGGERRYLTMIEDITVRREHDDRVQSLLAEYQAMFEGIDVGIASFRDGCIVQCNAFSARMFGYETDEMIGQDTRVLFASDEEHAAMVKLNRERLLPNGTLNDECRMVTKDGREIWIRFSAKLIDLRRPEQGHISAFMDITPRKLQEQKLRRALAELQVIFGGLQVGITHTRDRIIMQCNEHFEKMLGYAPGELLGQGTRILYPNDADYAEGGRKLARESGIPCECVFVRKDGSQVWVLVTEHVLRPGHPQDGVVAAAVDISERKRQEQQLDALLLEQRLMLESMHVGIVYSRERVILRCNQYFEELFGYARGELAGKDTRALYHGDEAYAAVGRLMQDSAGKPYEQEFRTRDGATVWCYVSECPADADDPRKGFVSVFFDISDAKQRERELGAARREQELLYNMSLVGLILTRGGSIVRGNETLTRMLGYATGELDGEPVALFYASGEEYERISDVIAGQLREHGESRIEMTLMRKDGTQVWCDVQGRTVVPGRIEEGVLYAIMDITERREQRRKLQQALYDQEMIFDTALVGLAITRDGKIINANRMAGDIFGYAPRDLQGEPVDILFASATQYREALKEFQEMIEKNGFVHVETELVRKGGSAVWCEIHGRPMVTDRLADGMIYAVQDITLRKYQQAILDNALHQQELLFDLAVVGLLFLRDGCFVKVNRKLLAIFGYAREELLGQSVALIHPSEALSQQRMEAVWTSPSGREAVQECEFVRKDGTRFWGQMVGRAVNRTDPDQGAIVAIIDIDEQKRAVENLRSTQHFLDLILENLPVLVSVKDAVTRKFLRVNRAAERITGMPREQVVGKTLFELYPENTAKTLAEHDRTALDDTGSARVFEEEVEIPGGGKRVLHTRIVPVHDTDGALRYLLTVAEDMTEQIRVREALRDSEFQFQQFADTIDQFVYVADHAHERVHYLNHRYEEVWGADSLEFFADPASHLDNIHPNDLARVQARAAREKALQPTDEEFRIMHPEKGLRWVRLKTVPTRHSDGGTRTLGIIEDISARKQQEKARFDEAIQQRDALVREVHHRIKNNLQGVVGLLQHNAREHPEANEVLQTVAGQVQAIAQVHGLQVRSSGRLQCDAMLMAIFGNLQVLAEGKLAVDLDLVELARVSLTEGESVPLALIVNELLTNAIKHRIQGSGVHAKAGIEGGELVIRIANRGELPSGFDFREVASGASGLGLVKALLPRKGARIDYAQNGNTVAVTLQLAAPVIKIEAGEPSGAA